MSTCLFPGSVMPNSAYHPFPRLDGGEEVEQRPVEDIRLF
jgi:hypothetical protein